MLKKLEISINDGRLVLIKLIFFAASLYAEQSCHLTVMGVTIGVTFKG
jgi:hypothetical protein